MPRYFFNTRIGDDLIPDPDGVELRDPDQAWEMARTMIQEILRDQRDQPNLLAASLEVTDERGEIVLEFPFTEALIAPPDEVKSAFDDVAREQTRIETKVNNAEQEAESQLKTAQSDQYRIEQETAAYTSGRSSRRK